MFPDPPAEALVEARSSEPEVQLEARVVDPGHLRNPPVSSFLTPHGTLKLYKNGDMVATCENPSHKDCVLKRSIYARRPRAKGRFIGLLYAFLMKGSSEEFVDAYTHVHHYKPDHAVRLSARRIFYGLDGARQFAVDVEREPYDGEGEEPQGFP